MTEEALPHEQGPSPHSSPKEPLSAALAKRVPRFFFKPQAVYAFEIPPN